VWLRIVLSLFSNCSQSRERYVELWDCGEDWSCHRPNEQPKECKGHVHRGHFEYPQRSLVSRIPEIDVMAMIAAEAAGIGRQRATGVASAVLLVKRAADVHMLADVAGVSDRLSQPTGLVKLAISGGDLLMAMATRIITKHGNLKSMSHLSCGLMCLLRDG